MASSTSEQSKFLLPNKFTFATEKITFDSAMIFLSCLIFCTWDYLRLKRYIYSFLISNDLGVFDQRACLT